MANTTRLTKALRKDLASEARSTKKQVNAASIENKDLKRIITDALQTMSDEQARRQDIVVAEAQLEGVIVAMRALAGSGSGGTGVVDCINKCHSEWEKCKKTNSQFLCSLQSIRCLAKCATASGIGIGPGMVKQ